MQHHAQHVGTKGDSCCTPLTRFLFCTSCSNLRATSVSVKKEGYGIASIAYRNGHIVNRNGFIVGI